MLFASRVSRFFALGCVVLLFSACTLSRGDDDDATAPALYEGDEPGECTDGADNDQDGLFDCNDEGCQGSPDCDGTGDDDDDDDDDDDTSGDDDDDDDDTSGDDDDDDDDSADDDDDDDDTSGGTATLSGRITTSVSPVAGNDGIGTLWVVIFSSQPFSENPSQVIGLPASTPLADFSAAGASYGYEITDIHPQAGPMSVLVLLDDSDPLNFTPGSPNPDPDDLLEVVTLPTLPEIVIDTATSYTRDFSFNLAGVSH